MIKFVIVVLPAPVEPTKAIFCPFLAYNVIFFKIVLLQVVKRILAPMSNEVITLVKDTALARVIMIVEIIQAAQNFTAYGLIWPLFYTAVFYLIFVGLLTLLFGYFEKKLSYYKV